MKALLLLTVLGIVGFFIYRDYFAAPEPVAVAPAPVPTPVPFAIKSAVRSLYEEWKRRELGEQGLSLPEPQKLIIEIKRSLFSKGEHTDAAIKRAVVQALGEMGIAPGEREHIAAGIMSMR